MIYLFTDYGFEGPYIGQLKSVLYAQSPGSIIIDLMHDAPACQPKAGSYLLAALVPYLQQKSIIVAVVDPGVGDVLRRPVMIETDQYWFIGPDNGLFNQIIKRFSIVSCYELIPDASISRTFHGRDVFAPAAASLAKKVLPPAKKINPSLCKTAWPDDLAEIIYIDGFGNSMLGLRSCCVVCTDLLVVGENRISHAETFSAVPKGQAFWYVNSIGLVEVSVNCGSAATQLELFIGKKIDVVSVIS